MRILDYKLEEIQQVLVEILLEIDRVCKKHNITYTLAFGTLLGAVRHSGFIPWDDDLDIAMMRDDYDKFTAVCKEELGAGFFLMTADTEEEYPYNFAKVVKEGTIFLEKGFEYRNVHKGIYVDIFPLDKVNIRTYAIQRRFFSFFRRARWYCIDKQTMPRKVWKESQSRKNCWFTAPFSIIGNKRLNHILEKIMRCYNDNQTKYVYVMCHPDGSRRLDKLAWYEGVVYLEFEGCHMPCPSGYEEILRQRYGEYWKLPPVDQRHPSHNIIEIRL